MGHNRAIVGRVRRKLVQSRATLEIRFLIAVFFTIGAASGCGFVGNGTSGTVPQSLTIVTPKIPPATVNSNYSTSLSASGGSAPYNWSIASGALPAGVFLTSSTGAISGSPKQAGTSNFKVQVQDSSSPFRTATQSYTMQVAAAGTSSTGLQITTFSLPAGTQSNPYSATLAASGGTQPYTWSLASNSGPLPQGLSLAATTGDITGTPGTAGQTSVAFQVTDSSAQPQTTTKTLTFFISGGQLDVFGGRMDMPCTVPATNGWSTAKINNQWYLCTPGGHALWFQSVENIIPTDSTAQAIVTSRYGGVPQWSEATLARLNAWGFNVLGEYSYNVLQPTYSNSTLPGGQHTIKLPYMSRVRPGFYSIRNPEITLATGGTAELLLDPSKDTMGARSSFYNAFVPGGGVMDYGDAKISDWLNADISQDVAYRNAGSPDSVYQIGFSIDDGDELWGIVNGPDFATNPPAHNSSELPFMIISESPLQWASQQQKHVYQDGVMHAKKMLHDALVAKYGTISALNQAWGSDYTTFDSSGTPVTATLCTSNGTTPACSTTLSKISVSARSLRIFVGDQTIAGDLGNGQIWGLGATGTVNYTTGALSLTFASGQIPAAGAVVSVSYIQNGWGIGTGLMDEDMRTAHQVWLGNSWDGRFSMDGSAYQASAPNVQADLNAYWKQAASWYFQMFAAGVHSRFPAALIISDLSSWDAPPPGPVLEAEAPYVDIEHMSETHGATSQAILDFIYQHLGDKPIIGDMFLTANADSDVSAFPDGQFPTQTARGQAYLADVQGMQAARNSAGINPHLGLDLWDWMDMWSEHRNWGLVSHLDNAYDGHEDVSSSVTCSSPIQQFVCGGEPGNYGDYITYVKQANLLWLTH